MVAGHCIAHPCVNVNKLKNELMSILSDKSRSIVGRTLNQVSEKNRYVAKDNFVVHRHKGSIIHYHLVLKFNGITRSWLIPNGPSLNPHDRRLAVMVSDQPLGEPASEKQEVWDKGAYASVGFRDENTFIDQIKSGNLKFVLNGKKLKGSFRLLQMKERGKNLWLLIKGNDLYAVDYHYNAEDFARRSSL
jgi:bifunctional non-homologous end joining protein LigD